jgi:hypothetical protein
MANSKKLTIQVAPKPALAISRQAFKAEKLVYLAVVNKPLAYPHSKSRIAYIGTTEVGASRMAASAAHRAKSLFALHGVKTLYFHVVTCAPRQKVNTWKKLESGLILAFKHLYGEVPRCNIQGKRKKWADELEYFTIKRLESVLKKHET